MLKHQYLNAMFIFRIIACHKAQVFSVAVLFSPCWHVSPWNVKEHSQLKPESTCVQVPPFWQGSKKHGPEEARANRAKRMRIYVAQTSCSALEIAEYLVLQVPVISYLGFHRELHWSLEHTCSWTLCFHPGSFRHLHSQFWNTNLNEK